MPGFNKDYLPTQIALFIQWCVAFLQNITSMASSLGVTPQTIEDYGEALAAAQASVALAANHDTRTRPVVAQAAADVKQLRQMTRTIVRQIQARPETTDAQREALNITVPDRIPTHREAPDEEPVMTIDRAVGTTLSVRIRRQDLGRGRPAGCIGANIYYSDSPTVPTTASGWTHAGQATRMTHQVRLPETIAPGSTVWLAANWYNGRGEVGPLSDAISTNLPGGQARVAG